MHTERDLKKHLSFSQRSGKIVALLQCYAQPLYTMKTFPLLFSTLLCCLFLLCLSGCQRSDTPPIKIDAYWGGYSDCGTSRELKVVAKVLNTSDDTLYLYSKACSWDDFWYVDSDLFPLKRMVCLADLPMVITLPPQHRFSNYLTVTTTDRLIENHDEMIRFGYDLILLDSLNADITHFPQTGMRDTIWTRTLPISHLFRLGDLDPYR